MITYMELLLLLTRVRLFATQWTAARQAFLSFTISQSLLKLMSMESVMPSNHLILCHPLLLLPFIFSSIRVFSNESVVYVSWPRYWSFILQYLTVVNKHKVLLLLQRGKYLPVDNFSKSNYYVCLYINIAQRKKKTFWAFVIIREMLFFKISYLSVSILNFF